MHYNKLTPKSARKTDCVAFIFFVFGALFSLHLMFTLLHSKDVYNPVRNEITTKILTNYEAHQDKVLNFLNEKTLELDNLLLHTDELELESLRRIFFIETHMNEWRTLNNPRQACSIESAGNILVP